MIDIPPAWAGQVGNVLIAALLAALFLTLVMTPLLMPVLIRWKMGQSVRKEGPQTHQKKQGTPTMGGVTFLATSVVVSLILAPPSQEFWWVLLSFLVFGLLGFADDFVKIVLRRPLGLKARYKLAVQLVMAVALAFYAYWQPGLGSSLHIPWVHWQVDLSYFYPALILFLVLGTTNATNLTDGLDGLLAGSAAVVFFGYAIVTLAMLKLSLTVICLAIAGGLLGFLWYNKHPARIFMGDTGSLAIGGALAAMSVMTKTELLLPIFGLLYVLEALSVILQVFSYRIWGRRLLRMSPLHHHFELSGWPETRVVAVFWLFTLLSVIVGLWGFDGWGTGGG